MSVQNMENEKPCTRREDRCLSIVISKIVFQSFIKTVLEHIVKELEKIQDFFLEKLYS